MAKEINDFLLYIAPIAIYTYSFDTQISSNGLDAAYLFHGLEN